jgi:hypothetical protein
MNARGFFIMLLMAPAFLADLVLADDKAARWEAVT